MHRSSNTHLDQVLSQIWQTGGRSSHQAMNAVKSANFRLVKIICWPTHTPASTRRMNQANIDADRQCDARPVQVQT